MATRLTVHPAVQGFSDKVPTALCPEIHVSGQRLHALLHDAAPLPGKLLCGPVDNVARQASALVAAIDVVLAGL